MRTLFIAWVVVAASVVGQLVSVSRLEAQNISSITGKLPLAQADRPLTMTHGTLRLDAAFAFGRACFEVPDLATGGTTTACGTSTFVFAGAGFSILDDFEVGALVLPLQLTDDFHYGDPSVYARFRFISGAFEMGAEVEARIGVLDVSPDFVLTPGIPIRLHLSERTLRLDTGAYLPIAFDADTTIGLFGPLALYINATPNFFFGPRTGLYITSFDAVGDSMVVPLGAFLGYTIDRGGVAAPLADVYVAFDWPVFFATGPGDAITANVYALTAGVSVYLGGS